MVSGISGYGSSMQMQSVQAQRQPKHPSPEDMFAKIDTSQDGAIDKVEFAAFDKTLQEKIGQTPGVDQFFEINDTNGDSLISKEEMIAGAEKMRSSGGDSALRGPGGAGGPSGGGEAGKTEGESSSAASTDPADTNGDGSVSLSEYIAYMKTKSDVTNDKVDFKELLTKLATSIDYMQQAYTAGSYKSGTANSTFSLVG